MLGRGHHAQSVYLALGSTDLRKAIDGLSILVQEYFELSPLSGSFFAFCNRRRTMVKILYWDGTGFCLWMKRLERGRFRWPRGNTDVVEVSSRELGWLLDGLTLEQRKAHRLLSYSVVA